MNSTKAIFLSLFMLSLLGLKAQFLNSDGSVPNQVLHHEIGFGLENYSKVDGITGGNYLFLSYYYQFNNHWALGSKFASDLAPNTFDDAISHLGMRYSGMYNEEDMGFNMGVYYVTNWKYDQHDASFIAWEVSLFTFHSDDNMEIDFLPISLMYATHAQEIAWNYKFVGIKINF